MVANITAAIEFTHPNPSAAQREAGNYRKGKLQWHGLTISIETPKGQRRKPDQKPLVAHYGYVLGTEGRDGDHVDVFIGPKLDSEIVFVIDQVTQGGRFDEHKAVIGVTSKKRAKQLYLANYPSGWKCGPITSMTVEQFKAWLEKGDQTRRVAEQVSRYDKTGSIRPIAGVKSNHPDSWAPGAAPQHRVGETKNVNGVTYRLNENSRWELASPEEANPQQPGASPEAAPPSPANDQAQRQQFVASKVKSLHPELGGLIQAIHESPDYKTAGEYVSFDVHKKVAADLHHSLSKRMGQEHGGGKIVDLGQGRVGFASEAGSLVVWPADETGGHRVSYTNKTGVVGRAMAKGGSGEEANGPPPAGQSPKQAQQVRSEADEREPVPPPRPGIPRGKPVEQPQQPAPTGQPGPAPQQQSSGKHPDEEAYDAELVPAKEKPAHVRLRARANQSKQRFLDAFARYEQAVDDRERPERIRKLKRQASELRLIANEHHRQASKAEAGHKARLRESGKQTKARMKQLGIGPYKPKPKAEKPTKAPKEPKPAKEPPEPETPLIDQAEKSPGQGAPREVSPEALEMGKLPGEAQRAGAAAQTYLKTAGLTVSPENHKAIQHAIRNGWIKNKQELRGVLRRAKAFHDKSGSHKYHELRGITDKAQRSAKRAELASSDHHALKDAIRRKANRERRESWVTTLKKQGEAWGMEPKEYHKLATEMYRDYVTDHQNREDAKRRIRDASGLNARAVQKAEDGGKDYSTVLSGIDKHLQQLAGEYPQLFEGKDNGEVAWELLKEGPKRVPSKLSDEFLQHVDGWLYHQQQAAGGDEEAARGDAWEPEEDELPQSSSEDPDALPFAKVRAGVVQRYRKWRSATVR